MNQCLVFSLARARGVFLFFCHNLTQPVSGAQGRHASINLPLSAARKLDSSPKASLRGAPAECAASRAAAPAECAAFRAAAPDPSTTLAAQLSAALPEVPARRISTRTEPRGRPAMAIPEGLHVYIDKISNSISVSAQVRRYLLMNKLRLMLRLLPHSTIWLSWTRCVSISLCI
jgi:hypothetical protein